MESTLISFFFSSSGSRLQVKPSQETDPSSQGGAGEDRVSSPRCPKAQPVLEPWDRVAHQQQQVECSSLKIPKQKHKCQASRIFNVVSYSNFWTVVRVTVAPDGVLSIHNISRADEGKYTCFAENYLGKANSTGHLSVRGAPRPAARAESSGMIRRGLWGHAIKFLPCFRCHQDHAGTIQRRHQPGRECKSAVSRCP